MYRCWLKILWTLYLTSEGLFILVAQLELSFRYMITFGSDTCPLDFPGWNLSLLVLEVSDLSSRCYVSSILSACWTWRGLLLCANHVSAWWGGHVFGPYWAVPWGAPRARPAGWARVLLLLDHAIVSALVLALLDHAIVYASCPPKRASTCTTLAESLHDIIVFTWAMMSTWWTHDQLWTPLGLNADLASTVRCSGVDLSSY